MFLSKRNTANTEAERHQFALIIDDQVQFESEEPTHGGLATSGTAGKDAVLVNASRLADGKASRVDEADACTPTQPGVLSRTRVSLISFVGKMQFLVTLPIFTQPRR